MLTTTDFNPINKLLTNPPRIREISFKDFASFYASKSKLKESILKLLVAYCQKLTGNSVKPEFLLIDGEFTKNDDETKMIEFILIFDEKNMPADAVIYNFTSPKSKYVANFRNTLKPHTGIGIKISALNLESEIMKHKRAELLQLGSNYGHHYDKAGLLLIKFDEVA